MKTRQWGPGCCVLFVAVAASLLLPQRSGQATDSPTQRLEALFEPVEIVWDSRGVPHIYAAHEEDLNFALGWVHAKDRFFQMDTSRRSFSGTLAELLGETALEADVLFRTYGLRRGAAESLQIVTPRTRTLLESYTKGVNAYLESAPTLPAEYQELEITQLVPWSSLDTLTVSKGFAFELSFDLRDVGLTGVLADYQFQGAQEGFDGNALFLEDVFRSAPFEPGVTVPDFLPGGIPASPSVSTLPVSANMEHLQKSGLELARQYGERVKEIPSLAEKMKLGQEGRGSNWWVISGRHTESGNPMLASDPHLALDNPALFYEVHLTSGGREGAPLDVTGMSFPGTNSIVMGCNTSICWAGARNPMDVTDYYVEELIPDGSFTPVASRFEGRAEPLILIPQTYLVNLTGDAIQDNLQDANVTSSQGGLTFVVPRRNFGPVVAIEAPNPFNPFGLSIQYTGWRGTREVEAFQHWARARNLDDFRAGLALLDDGSSNWAYADVEGNIAYFTSGEVPIREDLQTLGGADGGVPPFLFRDGTHFFRHEWLPVQNPQPGQALGFEILPFQEMPHVVNPAQGYIINANNDPVGGTLDNNPLNEIRPGGGVYYLNPGYASGFRFGRIRSLIESQLADDGKISLQHMKEFQANNQLWDAQVLLPYLLKAFDDNRSGPVDEILANLTGDSRVVEAITRLRAWDFSTPTGIQSGYDPGDDPDDLPAPSDEEIANSVAATIYSMWRSFAVGLFIDVPLLDLDLQDAIPGSQFAMSALRNLLDNFETNQGVGASGVQFVDPLPLFVSPEDARDILLLLALRFALDRLESEDLEDAFQGSDFQRDYRWGRLHRVTFSHPVEDFDIPLGGGFENLSARLPGIPRAGGFNTVDAATHSARSIGVNAFNFGSGPGRRFVSELSPGKIEMHQILAGGQSADPESPFFADQLKDWLTNRYRQVPFTRDDVLADQSTRDVLRPSQTYFRVPFFLSDPENFIGFAVSNRTTTPYDLHFAAREANGNLSDLPVNPSDRSLAEGRQLAQLGRDLFGAVKEQSSPLFPFGTSSGVDAWVEIAAMPSGDIDPVEGGLSAFMQAGNVTLTQLDGALARVVPSRNLVFTRAMEGATAFRGHRARTTVTLVNPGEEEIEVRLRLFASASTPAGTESPVPPAQVVFDSTRPIPSKGFERGTLSELFGQSVAISNGFLAADVLSQGGLIGFQLIELPEVPSIIGLSPQQASLGSLAYSAQLASTQTAFTNLNLINASGQSRRIEMTAVDSDGVAIGEPVVRIMDPGAQFSSDAVGLFSPGSTPPQPATTADFVGSLVVSADGQGLVGDVVFGDPVGLTYAASMPLQFWLARTFVYGQIASTADIFTGLALFNPNSVAARVQINVRRSDGSLVAAPEIILEPGVRLARTISQISQDAVGLTQGYIEVISDQPIASQELFGTNSLSFLSAVPPTIVN